MSRYGLLVLLVRWQMVTRAPAANAGLGAITKYWPSEKTAANNKMATTRKPFEA